MLASLAEPCEDHVMLALAVLLAASPSTLGCIDAPQKRNDLALRMRGLLMREIEQGGLNRAEIGAYRAAKDRRERLLECPVEREL